MIKNSAEERNKKYWIEQSVVFSSLYVKGRLPVRLFLQIRDRKLLHNLEGHACGRVLDVGCGDGRLLKQILCEDGMRVGMDISGGVLKQADAPAVQHIFFVGGDALRFPFRQNAFDVVIVSGVVDYFAKEKIPVVLSEIRRVLSPQGTCLMTVPASASPFFFFRTSLGNYLRRVLFFLPAIRSTFSQKEFAQLLENYGFSVKRTGHIFYTTWVFACIPEKDPAHTEQ